MAALQWGDRYPERAARDVVQVDIVEAGDTAGVTAVFAADGGLEVRPGGPALVHRERTSRSGR
jgi:hypothetical protein